MSVTGDVSVGNLVAAAMSADGWLRDVARGLIASGETALARLAAVDESEVRLFHAIALWIYGQDDEAARMLRQAPASTATEKLAAILRKDRIRVLGFLPPRRGGPHCLFVGARADPRFDISNVWFGAEYGEGIPNRVDENIHRFYHREAPPDFMVSEMAEWHVLPRNLAEAPFHKIAHTSDFDIHGQEVMPWLRQFDTVLTLDHTEWMRLRRALPDSQILTYPKAFGIADRSVHIPDYSERPIDILMTGTVLSEYHNDKNELLTRLTAKGDLKCVLLNGFVGAAEYENLTRRSKLTLSFVRHSGTMPTRALESLSLGTWSLIQADSALHLYLPEDPALLKYNFGDWPALTGDLQAFLRRCTENPAWYAERAALTRQAVHAAFSPARVGSQYMRFCAALPAIKAAIGMSGGSSEAPVPQMQKRGCVIKGWLPADGNEGVLAALRESNLRLASQAEGYGGFNDAGRENLIEYARLINAGDTRPALLQAAIEAWERAIVIAPGALAPRFNLIRCLYHFGTAADRRKAGHLLETTLILRRSGELSLDAADDLLPYDFYPSHFNGQLCNDLRLEAFGGNLPALQGVEDLIVASLHYYRARAGGHAPAAEADYQAALSLDSDNGHFRIAYAQYLLSTQPAQKGRALEILHEIADARAWTPVLGALLHMAGDTPSADRRQRAQLFDIEGETGRQERYALSRCLTMTGERYLSARQSGAGASDIALVVCGAGVSVSDAVYRALVELRQNCPEVEIVVIDTVLDCRSSPLSGIASLLVTVPQPGGMAYNSLAIASVIPQVQSGFVLVAAPDMADLSYVTVLARELAQSSQNGSDVAAHGRRPVLLDRKVEADGPQRELLAVGVHIDKLRTASLPQSIGMLQAANLTLPVLAHQLRMNAVAFRFSEVKADGLHSPDDDRVFELSDYVASDERMILSLLSPNWNQFIAESSAASGVAPDAAALQPMLAQHEGGVRFGRDSFVYRIARRIYRRYLKRDGDEMTPNALVLQLIFLRIEYVHPHLRVSFCPPRILRR